MLLKFCELRRREVINLNDGCRMGYVGDLEMTVPEGCIKAIIVYGRCRFFGLFGRGDDYVIPWNCIRKIGNDVLLCEVAGEYRREKPPRRFLF